MAKSIEKEYVIGVELLAKLIKSVLNDVSPQEFEGPDGTRVRASAGELRLIARVEAGGNVGNVKFDGII